MQSSKIREGKLEEKLVRYDSRQNGLQVIIMKMMPTTPLIQLVSKSSLEK